MMKTSKIMEDWGRYDSDSSSSSDDDVYFGDYRQKQPRQCGSSVQYKTNGGKTKNKSHLQPDQTTQKIGSEQKTRDAHDSFSSTSSSESPTYELNRDFSGSDSSFDDSSSPLDLTTPKSWKKSQTVIKSCPNRTQVIDDSKQNTYSNCGSLKWPTQRVIISCQKESKQKTDEITNSAPNQLNRNSTGQQSTSSFSSIKGEIGESPDFSNLDTPSPYDDDCSPGYQNMMKGKRLFDVRQKTKAPETVAPNGKSSISSFPSLASLNAFGFEGKEGLASYTSLPYTSYLDESVARFQKKSLSHLPSSSSIMSNFNETVNEREGMASMSNYSSMSSVMLKSTGIKGVTNSDLSPVSLISNFTEPLGEPREGLASYNSLSSLYKSPSESNYKENDHFLPSTSQLSSADYIDMNRRCGEALASCYSSFKSEPSSEETSLLLNSTVVDNGQSDYVDMNRLDETSDHVPQTTNNTYTYIDPKTISTSAPSDRDSRKGNRKTVKNTSNSAMLAIPEHFFTSEDLSGDYVELSKCQAYLAAMREKEKEKIPSHVTNHESRTISPSPVINLSLPKSDKQIDSHPNTNISFSYNKSTTSLVSFRGNASVMENDLTIGESLCERREALASCASLSEFDFDSEISSLESPKNSANMFMNSESNTVKPNIVCTNENLKLTSPPHEYVKVKTAINKTVLPPKLCPRKGTFSDSGVDCSSTSSPLATDDQVFMQTKQTTVVPNIPTLQEIPEVFTDSNTCSSLNTSSSVHDSGSASFAQSFSQSSVSSETSSISNCEKSVLHVIEKISEVVGACSECPSESANSTSSVNESASQTSNTSSNYALCSNTSNGHIANNDTEVKSIQSETNSSNLTDLQHKQLDGSKHSINSETNNASLLSLYGNGASTPRASASAAVSFPSHLLVSPISTYSRVQSRAPGGGRVVTSPCVKPSMLNLKEPNSKGAFLNYKTNTGESKAKRTLDNSANVNSDNVKCVKDKQILVDSLILHSGNSAISTDDLINSAGGFVEEEEEVQMVYANAFRRIDVGTSNTPTNVVVKSTIKRVPSLSGPKQTVPCTQRKPESNYFQSSNVNSYSNSLGSLNSQNVPVKSQMVKMRSKTASIQATRPQSAMGRMQVDPATLSRSTNSRNQYSISRVVRLTTANGRMGADLSPQRGMLPDIIPVDQQDQEEDILLPAPEIFYQVPTTRQPTSAPQLPPLPPVPIPQTTFASSNSATASNYMTMSSSSIHSHTKGPNSNNPQNYDTVSVSSLFQHAPEGHYELDSSNSSLDCDNFSFDFNQPEDSSTSVMFTSAVDLQQLEQTAETGVYQDIDDVGAYGGQEFNFKHRRPREKIKPYEHWEQRSPKIARKFERENKENSPDRRNYPKSPLPGNSSYSSKEKKPEASPPKKSSRFFTWPHKGDSSPTKSKLFGLKKKDKKEGSKSKRKKETYMYEPVPVFDHDTDWKTKLHTLCNGRRVVRYLNYSESPMIIKHYPPPKESTRIKWNSNLVQLTEESDDSNDYAVIHPKSILSKKSKEYKFDGDVPSPIIITKTRQMTSSGRRSSRK
ncbi:uncharacterized protein LOC126832328 [Patella vulgata]|uniref:uncharacterized protein LOC126832328 n=1 Tax=Patella vulgata TaxID=6465 RepID=UPI00217F8E5F|nr:uncharacterized protein LOC126832328 [Patella vulgata]